MRRALFVAVLFSMALVSVVSADEKKKEEDRWKISIGGVQVGLGDVSDTQNLGWGENYRADQGIKNWRKNFYQEYLFPNSIGLLNQSTTEYFLEVGNVLCCTANTALLHARDFRGEVGDEYLLWTRTEGGRATKNGVGFSSSLEYRVKGGLWAAFSFQMSAENELQRTESGEYVRLTDIEGFPADRYFNFSHPVPYWYIKATRHRIVRESQDKHRFFTFSLLGKYDLTRGNDHWSILPQGGLELMLSREYSMVTEEFLDWRIFSGEHHPSSWAQRPRRADLRERESVRWRDWVRPVAGLTVELFPGGKDNVVGIVLDARYRFLGEQPWTSRTNGNVNWHGNKYWGPVAFDSDDEFIVPYWYNADANKWTISVGGVFRF